MLALGFYLLAAATRADRDDVTAVMIAAIDLFGTRRITASYRVSASKSEAAAPSHVQIMKDATLLRASPLACKRTSEPNL